MAQIVLLEELRNRGKVGDLITVRDGYARNYLLPQGKAVRATPANLRRFEVERARVEILAERTRQEALALAERLALWSPALVHAAQANGNLYGGISVRDLARIAAADGYDIRSEQIHLAGPIKAVGTHYAKVRLYGDIEQEVIIHVGRSHEEIDEARLDQSEEDRRQEAVRLIDLMAVDQVDPNADFTSRLLRLAELVSEDGGQAARAAWRAASATDFDDALRPCFEALDVDCLIRVLAEPDPEAEDLITVSLDVCGALPVNIGNGSTFRISSGKDLKSARLKLSTFSPWAALDEDPESYAQEAPDGEIGRIGIRQILRRSQEGSSQHDRPAVWAIAHLNGACVHRRVWHVEAAD